MKWRIYELEEVKEWAKAYLAGMGIQETGKLFHVGSKAVTSEFKKLEDTNSKLYALIQAQREVMKTHKAKQLTSLEDIKLKYEKVDLTNLGKKITKDDLCNWACKNNVNTCMRDLMIKARENNIEVVA